MQLAGIIALKTFASCACEIAHRRIAKSRSFRLVAELMKQALENGDLQLADEMLEFFYIIDGAQMQGDRV